MLWKQAETGLLYIEEEHNNVEDLLGPVINLIFFSLVDCLHKSSQFGLCMVVACCCWRGVQTSDLIWHGEKQTKRGELSKGK